MNSDSQINGAIGALYKTYDEHSTDLHFEHSKQEYLQGVKATGSLGLVLGASAAVASYALDFPFDTAVGYIGAIEAGLRSASFFRPVFSSRLAVTGPSVGLVGAARKAIQKVSGEKELEEIISDKVNARISQDV